MTKLNFMKPALLSSVIGLMIAGCSDPTLRLPLVGPEIKPNELCLPHAVTNNANAYNANDVKGAINPNAPGQYVVKKGDTLWDISRRFLVKPWYWKKIWHNNPHISNPHLIYPGDVLQLVHIDGQPRITITETNNTYHGSRTGKRTKDGRAIVKYSPHTRTEVIADEAISFSSAILNPHILKTRVLNAESVKALPFIYGSGLDYVNLNNQTEVYAKGIDQAQNGAEFGIYRPLGMIHNFADGKVNQQSVLGQEMKYIGKVGIITQDHANDLTKLKILESVDAIQDGDRLIASNEDSVSNYFPQLPSNQCSQGHILQNTSALPTIKEFDTIITSLGKDNGAQVGDIWKIVRQGGMKKINSQDLSVPDREVGYLMIIGVEDTFSYGFVLESKQNIYLNDALVRP